MAHDTADKGLIALKWLLFGVLCGAAVVEIYHRARGMYFSPDEIHNLDPIITFFRTGDYTSTSQGGHPFDPVLSAGVLATWINGVVFVLGGNLFAARLTSGLAQLVATLAIATTLLRATGLRLVDAAVVAVAVWVALLPAGASDLRITNGGEIWGFLYLLAGVSFVTRAPRAAAFTWGLAVWLVKIIYLPFAAAGLAALVWAEHRDKRLPWLSAELFRAAAALLGSFLLPLFAWMVLIWIRYDAATLVAWAFSYVTFVAKHSAAVALEGLPTLPGWSFNPPWNDQPFLSGGQRYVSSYLIPLGCAAAAVAAHVVLRLPRVVRPSHREAIFVNAAILALGAELAWFFAFDPTQWGRHLMPSLYVATALGVYCLADVWRNTTARALERAVWATAVYAAIVCVSFVSIRYVSRYVAATSWHASYARNCRGSNVLSSPCAQNDALELIAKWTRELCGTERNPFDPAETCMTDEREQYLARAVAMLEDARSAREEVDAALYTIIVLQNYNYQLRPSGELNEQEFLTDFAPLVCASVDGVLRDRLAEGGIYRDELADVCRARDARTGQRFTMRAA